MKAVVHVEKSAVYSEYNGLTFPVKDLLSSIIGLKMPSKYGIDREDTVDFTFDEVTIVDIKEEIAVASKRGDAQTLSNLERYCKHRRIRI